jgi:AcrR family transcriptional regulator
MQILRLVSDDGEGMHHDAIAEDRAALDAGVGVHDAPVAKLYALLHEGRRMNVHEWRHLASITGRLQVGAGRVKRRPDAILDIMSSTRRPARALNVASNEPAGDPATRRRILDAAHKLLVKRGGADVKLSDVARAARVSRQAIYLHFADRADLFTAVVRHGDEQLGIPAAVRRIADAPSGVDAIRAMVALQARLNPEIWPIARAFEAVRRLDAAAERSWQDRLEHRMGGCRAIAARLVREGTLRAGMPEGVAADLLHTLTSLRMWEDLVLERGWSARQYEEYVGELAVAAVT